jgi:hypothetical protein
MSLLKNTYLEMKKRPKLLIVPMIFFMLNCAKEKPDLEPDHLVDNQVLKEMYLKDIEIRALDERTDTVNLESFDKVHREKVFELLADNKIVSPNDKYRAALILQHTAAKICDGEITSISPENYLLAFHLSQNAMIKTPNARDLNIPRMVALNYDRYLLYSQGYQKYGTQLIFDDTNGEMVLAPIDTTLATDEERSHYQVESLRVLLSKHKIKSLSPSN